jgi:hypothetical protein
MYIVIDWPINRNAILRHSALHKYIQNIAYFFVSLIHALCGNERQFAALHVTILCKLKSLLLKFPGTANCMNMMLDKLLNKEAIKHEEALNQIHSRKI